MNYYFVAKNLTAESYSLLLKTFSSDEAEAASAYAKLRDSLIRFFQIKGNFSSDEAADETLDRVAAKLGEAVLIEDLRNTVSEWHGLFFSKI